MNMNGRWNEKSAGSRVKAGLVDALRGGILLALLCSIGMLMLPQMCMETHAAGTGKNLQLGAGVLAPVMTNTYEPIDLGEKNRVTTAQEVYYGMVYGTQKWLVIGYDGNGAVCMDDTVTLFAPDNFGTAMYSSTNDDNSYVNSYIRSRVDDGITVGYDYFEPFDQDAVLPRTLAHGDYSSSDSNLCDGISDTSNPSDHMWLLSTKEADLIGKSYRAASGDWWLRSPGSDNYAAYVESSGTVKDQGSYDLGGEKGVRPAFNLNLSDIVFTSAAEGGKTAGTIGTLTAPSAFTGNQWKLTILDHNDTFSASRADSGIVPAGSDVSISYSNLRFPWISAILLDSSGNLLYYGHILEVDYSTLTSGTVSVTIPSGLADGTYTLQVFDEDCRGDKITDIASAFSTISITVGKKTPTANDFTVTLPSNTVCDGSAKSVSAVAKSGVTGMGTITVKYYDGNGTQLSGAPTGPGTYTVKLDVAAGTSYTAGTGITKSDWTFTIAQKPAPTANDFTVTLPTNTVYDGNEKTASAAAKSGVTGMGTITVKYYDGNGSPVTGAPTEVGTYTVKLDVAEGTAYAAGTDITSSSWTFTIAQKPVPTANDFTVTLPTGTYYDGNVKTASAVAKSGVTGMGTITVKYYDGDGALLSGAPSAIGTYTIKLDVAEGTAYAAGTDITSSSWTFTIAQKGTPSADDFTVTLPSDTFYDGNAKTVTAAAKSGVTGMGNITVKYYDEDGNELSGVPTDVGTYTIKLDVAEGSAYLEGTDITSSDWTFEITSAPVAVSGVSISPSPLEIEVGETKTLHAVFYPSDATNRNVTWTSDDESIATVTSDGDVTGVQEGVTTIRVETEDGPYPADCEVTVTPATRDHSTDREDEDEDEEEDDDEEDKKVTTPSENYDYAEVDGRIVYGGLVDDVFSSTTMIPASAYPKFNDFMAKKIRDAEAGSAITVNAAPWTSINKALADAFTEKGDVSLTLIYTPGTSSDAGTRTDSSSISYQVTIPAGTNLSEYLDANGYIGFSKLGELFGNEPVIEQEQTELFTRHKAGTLQFAVTERLRNAIVMCPLFII